MSGSRYNEIILAVYSDKRSVFTLTDIAMLIGESNFDSINRKLNYYVSTGKLFSPRKGIYVKKGYNPEELACVLYTPSYISLEYVLLKAGIIFQYDERITSVSYLSRTIHVENQTFSYRKIKGEILIASEGIIQDGNVNMATPERAFLDMIYLNKAYSFDNLNSLNKVNINKMIPIYNSKTLTDRVYKMLSNG